ncbi:bifunctional DNA primase/polymerase [Gordonia polyisoprenivorans]|uniref:bifunctional DNA primase/polymerase n=1 Tax=Gordonia polyisoprenivorans TaxID=84595 RepID=UPI002234470D|nr:bifunctional DNA primase/polymerase [Gordonia polyisoprenivorans]
MDISRKSAALFYASLGLPVGPCAGKIPLTAHGFKDFTTDPDIISQWWTAHPEANVGLRPSLVVDIDTKHDGHLHLAKLLVDNGYHFPKSLTAHTGSHKQGRPDIRGMHAYFTVPEGLRWKGTLCKGVDLKVGATGYVIAPPSVNPATGLPYLWANNLPMALAPRWLITAGQLPKPQTRPVFRAAPCSTAAPVLAKVAEATPGGRHDMFRWACKVLAEDGRLTSHVDDLKELWVQIVPDRGTEELDRLVNWAEGLAA